MARLWSALRGWLDFYSPQAWLIYYYPLIYLAKVARNYPELRARERPANAAGKPATRAQNGFLSARVPSLEVLILSGVVFSSFYYTLSLYRLFFLGNDFWKRRLPGHSDLEEIRGDIIDEENPYGFAINVPAELLKTPIETGLSKHEITARREKFGPNQIEKRRNWLLYFQRYLFINPIVLLLEAAASVALVFQDWQNLLVICGLLTYNAYYGIQQIRQYDDLARTLGGSGPFTAVTLREGAFLEISAIELVPGDVVHVSEGSILPADCRVATYDSNLCVDQSNITGDRDGVDKHHGDRCHFGTTILRGDALLIVLAIGHQTFTGRTLSLINDPMPTSTSQAKRMSASRQQKQFNKVLHSIGATQCLVVTAALVVLSTSLYQINFSHRLLESTLALVIVGMPPALIALIDGIREHGAARLAEQGALITTTEKVEGLAGIDLVCVDKTGTITENRLTLAEPYMYSLDCDPEDLMLTACLTCSPDKQNLDPVDRALLKALKDFPRANGNLSRYKILDYRDFDTTSRTTECFVESPSGERILCVKGGPGRVLERFVKEQPDRREIQGDFKDMAGNLARRGLRSLGVARRRENHKWELLGLLPLRDSPRYDTAPAIKLAKTLGISTKIFTGEGVAIVEELARSIGIGTNVVIGEVLGDDKLLPNSDLPDRIEAADVYAEIFSEQKETIIRILQDRGHFVAATGDGVNDAPLLRRADAGIAVEGATETAQSAADVVFHMPELSGFAPIISAAKTSRQIFQQIHTYVTYRTTISLHLVLVLTWSFTNGNECFDINALIVHVHFADIVGLVLRHHNLKTPFSRTPARWNNRQVWTLIIPLSVISAICTWLVLATIPALSAQGTNILGRRLPTNTAEGIAIRNQVLFLQIVLSEHWLIFVTRTNGFFWLHTPSWRLSSAVFLIDLAASLLCLLGWVGGGYKMSFTAATRVWIFSFGTFCTAAGVCCLLQKNGACDVLLHA